MGCFSCTCRRIPHQKCLSLIFLVIFLYQFAHLISSYVKPTQLNTVMEIVKKDQLGEFPLVFKFCVRPGFNVTELRVHGYQTVDTFFWGWKDSSYYNVGWAGANASISPAGKITLQ